MLGLFSALKLAPKFKLSWIVVGNFLAFLLVIAIYLPYDITSAAFAGMHFALLAHVYHYTYLITSNIKEEKKRAQMNIKRKKSLANDQEITGDESKVNEEDDATSSISVPNYL
ncbi:hypothetical protein HDV01_000327 [Terramyces sp. JEL0728]|nr:hypothetical protein HDV01_000327 [Terramyces sp. JEL0728]